MKKHVGVGASRRSSMFPRVVAGSVLVALCACRGTGTDSPQGPTKVHAQAASGQGDSHGDSQVELEKRIALAPPGGSGAADALIVRLQRVATGAPTRLDAWIALGRAWVRKARASSDPGFYVNANACADVALGIVPDDYLARDLKTLVVLNDHKFLEARDLAAETVRSRP